MGIRTLQELQIELDLRKEQRNRLIRLINEFCGDQYGVRDYRLMVAPFINPDRLAVCLARQIPTANVEHIALHLFAQWLCRQGIPADPMPLSVIEDAYLHSNPGKKAAVKVPFVGREHTGRLKRTYQYIVTRAVRRNIDGKILSRIQTASGFFLPEYHATLREKVFGSYGVRMDLTDFFMSLLAACAKSDCPIKPKTMFLETLNRE